MRGFYMLRRTFAQLRRNAALKKKCNQFVIKRYREFLTTVISAWRRLGEVEDRNQYLKYKANEYREAKVKCTVFSVWKEDLKRNAVNRKLQRFLNYWKRMFRRSQQDVERFSLGCRKRHLTSFYFKQLKRAIGNSKLLRKTVLHRKRVFFSALRKYHLSKKILTMKKSLALQYSYNTYYRKLVGFT